MKITPYLNFPGTCAEAFKFYAETLGGEITFMQTHGESPMKDMFGPEWKDKIMHACFRIGDSEVMASDGMCNGKPSFGGFALSVAAKDDADAKKKFDALAEGGEVKMPIAKTFFASSFGMVADRFGLTWMVIAGQEGKP